MRINPHRKQHGKKPERFQALLFKQIQGYQGEHQEDVSQHLRAQSEHGLFHLQEYGDCRGGAEGVPRPKQRVAIRQQDQHYGKQHE